MRIYVLPGATAPIDTTFTFNFTFVNPPYRPSAPRTLDVTGLSYDEFDNIYHSVRNMTLPAGTLLGVPYDRRALTVVAPVG